MSPIPASATIKLHRRQYDRHGQHGTDIVQVGGAQGGALYNGYGSATTLAGCTFDHNQAIGGQGNTGSGPFIVVGTGEGGRNFFWSSAAAWLGPNTVTTSATAR